jgi:hypothetical protein
MSAEGSPGVKQIPVEGIRGIIAGFVGMSVSSETAKAATWSLMQRWNPRLAERIEANPEGIQIAATQAPTTDQVIGRFKTQLDEEYPACDRLVIQHSDMQVAIDGTPTDITAFLATYCETQAGEGKQDVIVVAKQDLELEPV